MRAEAPAFMDRWMQRWRKKRNPRELMVSTQKPGRMELPLPKWAGCSVAAEGTQKVGVAAFLCAV